MHLTEADFDEKFYLETWWDVNQAVAAGHFGSGYAHWRMCGLREGRVYKAKRADRVFGALRPLCDTFERAPDAIIDMPFSDYHHRGFRVKCCIEAKTRERIASEASRVHNGSIVEVGVFGGATLLHLSSDAIAQGNRLIGVDPWESGVYYRGSASETRQQDVSHFLRQLRWNLEQVIETLHYEHITLVQGFSVSAAKAWETASIDLLFLDGDHSAEAVRQDLAAWWPKIKRGGALWGDDFNWTGVRQAAHAFASAVDVPLEVWNKQFILRKPL